MKPAALLAGGREHLADGFPEAQCAVTDGQHRVVSAQQVTVVAEDLTTSGTHVADHADQLLAKHTAAASWMESSMPFLPAVSAAALAAKAAKAVEWQHTTVALTMRLGEHAEALHDSAVGYCRVDEHNATRISDVREV
jgi:hypothetical protein